MKHYNSVQMSHSMCSDYVILNLIELFKRVSVGGLPPRWLSTLACPACLPSWHTHLAHPANLPRHLSCHAHLLAR